MILGLDYHLRKIKEQNESNFSPLSAISVDLGESPLGLPEIIREVMFNYAHHLLYSTGPNMSGRLRRDRGSPHHFGITVLKGIDLLLRLVQRNTFSAITHLSMKYFTLC